MDTSCTTIIRIICSSMYKNNMRCINKLINNICILIVAFVVVVVDSIYIVYFILFIVRTVNR